MKTASHHCEILVIGSGPGGSMTACQLAEAGHDVLLVEEGSHHPITSAENYTLEEMNQKYRNGGLTPAFGRTSVTYVEGRCVGGASEVNAALYHRPIPAVLRDWALRFQIDDMSMDTLAPHFDAVEREVSVSHRPGGVGPASEKLRAGAKKLGWKVTEIERFWEYQKQDDGTFRGRRMSMTETLIPRALAAGCRLVADTRVQRIVMDGPTARRAVAVHTPAQGEQERLDITFQHVFVCCGAVQTPALLRRSGVKQNIGDALRMHQMIRVAARFPQPFNDPSWGVPVEQVEEFKPQITLGCSHSSLAHLALWLEGESGADRYRRLDAWEDMAIFYVAVTGRGTGTVRNLPLFPEPLVRYPVLDDDLALLGEGLYRLGQLIFEAGGQEIFSPVAGQPPIRDLAALRRYRTGIPTQGVNVSSIHVFCSSPMGEDTRRCAVDSWGKAHGRTNLYLNDSSILPDTPGVNPQGTILALARRNVQHFLEQIGG